MLHSHLLVICGKVEGRHYLCALVFHVCNGYRTLQGCDAKIARGDLEGEQNDDIGEGKGYGIDASAEQNLTFLSKNSLWKPD